jgi:hypothetical protein
MSLNDKLVHHHHHHHHHQYSALSSINSSQNGISTNFNCSIPQQQLLTSNSTNSSSLSAATTIHFGNSVGCEPTNDPGLNINSNSTTLNLSRANFASCHIGNSSRVDDDIKKYIYLRNLCPNDITELKSLCAEWFPVE